MVDAVSESQNHRVQEAIQDNTKNLEDVYRYWASRSSTGLGSWSYGGGRDGEEGAEVHLPRWC